MLSGLKWPPARGERGFAARILMDMDRVLAGGQVHEIDLDVDAATAFDFGDDGCADAVSLRVFQFDGDGFRGGEGE